MPTFTRWIPRFWQSKISTLGVAMTTLSAFILLGAIAAEYATGGLNVYATAILFMVMPFFFITGLILIPLGLWWRRRSEKKGIAKHPDGSVSEILGKPRVRRTLFILGGATIINVLIVGVVGAKAVSYMETPEFCGTLCHTIMQPEYEAYQRSPHSRVKCVECHVGPGAEWALKSKLTGLRQVWHSIMGDYARPIHAPVYNLREAAGTCEQCHQRDTYHGNRLTSRVHYQEDEENSALYNVLTMHLGGKNAVTGAFEGIHWHMDPNTQVRYEALDDKRAKIGKIEVLQDGKVVRTYMPPEEGGDVVEVRTMDCIDCHNRPTHRYDGTRVQALDLAFAEGRLDQGTPWLRTIAVPLLERVDRARDGVEAEFEKELAAAYAKEKPEVKLTPEQLKAAAAGLADIYRRNIWPRMKIGWNTYPSHIGHLDEHADVQGCFRCHNETHKTSDGKVLSQDCELCHEQLTDEEARDEIDEGLRTLLWPPEKDDD